MQARFASRATSESLPRLPQWFFLTLHHKPSIFYYFTESFSPLYSCCVSVYGSVASGEFSDKIGRRSGDMGTRRGFWQHKQQDAGVMHEQASANVIVRLAADQLSLRSPFLILRPPLTDGPVPFPTAMAQCSAASLQQMEKLCQLSDEG